jgi:hypothetical protein
MPISEQKKGPDLFEISSLVELPTGWLYAATDPSASIPSADAWPGL